MSYRLVFSPSFETQVDRQVDYLLTEQHVSMETIQSWFDRLYRRLDSLTAWPEIHPVDERYSAEIGLLCRKINFGDYLVFYCVDEPRMQVRVVAMVHGATRD